MTVNSDVNFEELARSTDEFNGAQLKAVCVEAGMIALREGATKLGHEHFLSGIAEGKEVRCPLLLGPFLTHLQQYKARKRTTSCTLPRRGSVDPSRVRGDLELTVALFTWNV